MTVSEAATKLGVHRTTIWRWIEDGLLPSRRVGPIIVVKASDVERLAAVPPEQTRGYPRGRPRKQPEQPA